MKTSAQFDSELVNRIRQFPHPRSFRGRVRRLRAWLANIDREAAMDSLRNVLAVIGCAAVLAYLSTMPKILLPVGIGVFVVVLWLDYERHF